MQDIEKIRELISLIDLTSLSEDDTKEDISILCRNASYKKLKCASVCIYPKFISHAKKELEKLGNTKTKVATVVNFPHGENNIHDVVEEIEYAIGQGVNEIDAVIPYKELKKGNNKEVEDFIEIIRKSTKDIILKVILETGELTKKEIQTACDYCIKNHVDFIKTSTGKTSIGATKEAVETILEQIVLHSSGSGLKVSGGVQTYEDAIFYSELFVKYLPTSEFNNVKFRIGASSLLKNLIDKATSI